MGFSTNDSRYAAIRDYAIIGNCHTAALIRLNGSLDWYCPQKFDGASVFAKILDAEKGGCYQIGPANTFTTKRCYLDNTNILQTTFTAGDSRARLIDFMPVSRLKESWRGQDTNTPQQLLRLIEGLAGQIEFEITFQPAFNYARDEAKIHIEPEIGIIAQFENQYLLLSAPDLKINFHPEGGNRWVGRFSVSSGERQWLSLTSTLSLNNIRQDTNPRCYDEKLKETRSYWEAWAKRCTYNGPYRAHVIRSALALKLLTYEPTGAIIAAPTTSLPEEIGGLRNWDYRFSWLRDSTLVLYALLNIGYREEAADFFEWLQKTHSKNPTQKLQLIYGIHGRRDLTEKILDHLEGYKQSRPVRIGNAASKQKQLDIYGEVLTAAYLYFKARIGVRDEGEKDSQNQRLLETEWELLKNLVNTASQHWTEPDNGIWEVRGGMRQFVYSKLMCWAALDRGIRLATEFRLPAPIEDWKAVRTELKKTILSSGFSKEIGSFVQTLGGSALDSSTLLIPRVGLVPVTDSRLQSTIDRIQKGLTQNGLLYRYRTKDGLPGSEGTFATCTFWLVEALALSGRLQEAHNLFEHVLSYCNDVGLLSEEIDANGGEFLGNFPQGFSHVALINAAVNLAKGMKHGAEQKSQTEYQRARKAGPAASLEYSRP